jgi:outer membrane immunogenic protein
MVGQLSRKVYRNRHARSENQFPDIDIAAVEYDLPYECWVRFRHWGATMRQFFIIPLSLLCLGVPAIAADLPSAKEAPLLAPITITNWSGFYGGVNVGAGIGSNSLTTFVPGAPNTLYTLPFDGSLSWGHGIPSTQDALFLGGLQLGYNYQTGPWVLGLEADFQWATVPGATQSSFAPTTGILVTNVNSADTPWFGTIRGRIGSTFVDPSLLLYVTGGYAYGRDNARNVMTVTDSSNTVVEAFPFGRGTNSGGYAVGLGAEYALTSHWSIKAEYLYVNLGSGFSQIVPTTVLGPSALPTDAMRATFPGTALNVLRLGVNYRFGEPAPIVAKF